MHCKAKQVLRVLFSANQGNGSDNDIRGRGYQNQPQKLENLAMINYDSDGRFEPLNSSGKTII